MQTNGVSVCVMACLQSSAPVAQLSENGEETDETGSEGEEGAAAAGGEGSDWSDSDGERETGERNGRRNGLAGERRVTGADGRVRRAALFSSDTVSAGDVSSDDDDEDEEEEMDVSGGFWWLCLSVVRGVSSMCQPPMRWFLGHLLSVGWFGVAGGLSVLWLCCGAVVPAWLIDMYVCVVRCVVVFVVMFV